MVQQAPPSFCVGLHHTRAEGGGVPSGCFSRVTLSVKAGEGHMLRSSPAHLAGPRPDATWVRSVERVGDRAVARGISQGIEPRTVKPTSAVTLIPVQAVF